MNGVNTNQVSPSQLKRMCSPEDRAKVDRTLTQPGMGAALYQDSTGDIKMLVSYGNRFADIGTRFAPSAYGDFVLRAFCPPDGALLADQGISPALRNRDVIAQISAPPRSPSVTIHPGQRTGLESVMPVLGLGAGAHPVSDPRAGRSRSATSAAGLQVAEHHLGGSVQQAGVGNNIH
jgi:hypothetical protein